MTLQALTLDLDDTLWPIWPTIERAEAALWHWLAREAPATAALNDAASLRAVRLAVEAEHPDWAHDFTRLRRESIRRVLRAAGDDPALADPAFEVFFAARQQVELFADALPALERLAARWPLVAVSNGNADLQRIGLARYFRGSFSAREFAAGKPEPMIFHAACRHVAADPAHVLHVGDDARLDVDGALQAGLQAAWVRRPGQAAQAEPVGEPQHRVHDLLVLAASLGA